MGLSLRTGIYGSYWGNDYNSSNALNQEQMYINAKYIYSYLMNAGWTINSISALLGNMESESSINPGRWQSDSVGWSSGGYGLVQWTPTTKYFNWCDSSGYSDPSEMDSCIARILYEVENNIQWGSDSNGNPPPYNFKGFTTSSESVSELAVNFLLHYERPADQSDTVKSKRSTLANKYYTYLTGQEPDDPWIPDTPTTKITKKRKFKFILFKPKRRIL